MGKQRHHSKGDGNGPTSELPLSYDDLLCNYRKYFRWQVTALLTLFETLAPAINIAVIEKSILPMMDKLVSDDIPNIRFNIAKSYAVLIDVLKRLPADGTIISMEKSGQAGSPHPRGQDLINHQILPNLEKLQQDEDVDVRYFATTAAGSASDAMQTSP